MGRRGRHYLRQQRDAGAPVLALPCHRELRPGEIDWLAARLREAVLA
ncbi:hypothetical protein [Massilia sp. Se16.2.3]|nr:hypothetical protein [Massilia sp. Se16.2.3]